MVTIRISIPAPSGALVDQLARRRILGDAVDLREGVHLESQIEWPQDKSEEIAGNAGFAMDGALPAPKVIHLLISIASGVVVNVIADEIEQLLHGPKVSNTETVIIEQQTVSLGEFSETFKCVLVNKREER